MNDLTPPLSSYPKTFHERVNSVSESEKNKISGEGSVEINKEEMKGFINTTPPERSGPATKPRDATCECKGIFGISDTDR